MTDKNGKNIRKISTHTLTWSVTIYSRVLNNFIVISTHTLTWSVTIIPLKTIP